MLVCRLARVTPGRGAETDLGVITIAPLRAGRGWGKASGLTGSFGCHIVMAGDDPDERAEQHVQVDDWPTSPPPPAVDLLAHALNLARAERELVDDNPTAIPRVAVMRMDQAYALVKIARAAISRGETYVDRDLEDVMDIVEAQMREAVAG